MQFSSYTHTIGYLQETCMHAIHAAMIQLSSAVNYLCTPIWIPLSCSWQSVLQCNLILSLYSYVYSTPDTCYHWKYDCRLYPPTSVQVQVFFTPALGRSYVAGLSKIFVHSTLPIELLATLHNLVCNYCEKDVAVVSACSYRLYTITLKRSVSIHTIGKTSSDQTPHYQQTIMYLYK